MNPTVAIVLNMCDDAGVSPAVVTYYPRMNNAPYLDIDFADPDDALLLIDRLSAITDMLSFTPGRWSGTWRGTRLRVGHNDYLPASVGSGHSTEAES